MYSFLIFIQEVS